MSKKPAKKVKPKSKGKGGTSKELTDDQLQQVAGGAAADYFLKIDGVQGESQQKVIKLFEATPFKYLK